MNAQAAYLSLLKHTLTAYVFPESADRVIEKPKGHSPKDWIKRTIVSFAAKNGIRLVKVGQFDPVKRTEGRDWPTLAYTMVGLKRLDNVQHAIETVIAENVPGDVAECGVWRGGCAIFMRATLDAHGDTNRTVWVADSFEGLPKPETSIVADKDYDLSEIDFLSVGLDCVKQNFKRFGLLDGKVKFLKGWFKDSLPTAPVKQLAVLRADGDLYESTMQILDNLYHKVSPGGFVIIDDYNSWPPCKQAVTDFRRKHGITAPIETIDWTGSFWRVPFTGQDI